MKKTGRFQARWIIWLVLLLACPLVAQAGQAEENLSDDHGVVVLMYSHFADAGGNQEAGSDASQYLAIDRLNEQITILQQGDYHIMPLTELAQNLRQGQPLPDRSVAITIDNAYNDAWLLAIPRLLAAKMPFTLFIATDLIDAANGQYMSWEQIRSLISNPLVTIGLRGSAHMHMTDAPPDQVVDDLTRAKRRLRMETGLETSLFSYPYGEYNDTLVSLLREQGFDTAFGIHSGVVDGDSDPMILPRFPMIGSFGDVDRFRLSINALPLAVFDLEPADTQLTENPPEKIGFGVDESVGDLSQLQCFASDQGQVPITIDDQRHVTIRINYPFAPGRARINCTLPGPADDRSGVRWRWFGRQFSIREK